MRRAPSLLVGFWNSLFTKEDTHRMHNLAGRADCDRIIARELDRARIGFVRLDSPLGEVPSLLNGRLGPISFSRESTYYLAVGPIPVEVARYLYRDPIGQCDALIQGNRNRPAPEVPWVSWYTTAGARVYPCVQEAAFREVRATWASAFVGSPPVFHDRPEAMGAIGFVHYYHLISEDGLQVFASALRRYSVDQRPVPSWWNSDGVASAQWDPFAPEVDTHSMEPQ